ncbi:MAG: hypothetical protein ACFFFG_18130 [Candidatus Thorarchaeota archaeon]
MTVSRNYTEYIGHRARLINVLALLCGFTFTSTIILVTNLPEPIPLSSQLILLFSAVLLDLFVLLLLVNMLNIFFYIEDIPEPTRTTNFISAMSVVTIGFWGFLLPCIFLIFGFEFLALSSGIIWAFILVLGIALIWRPFERRRRHVEKPH